MDKDQIEIVSITTLSSQQETEFNKVLKEVSKNEFLSEGEEQAVSITQFKETFKRCDVILLKETQMPIGFFTPRRQSVNGVNHWRAGMLYVSKRYQNQGVAYLALKEFFDCHQPGLSWIDDANHPSIGLFKKLGFTQSKSKEWEGHQGHWYVKAKTKLSAEQYEQRSPIYFRW